MVDTISIALLHPIAALSEPPGWKMQTSYRRDGVGADGLAVSRRIYALHEETGMRIWGEGETFLRAEFSLPRMEDETNNNLLETQQTLNAALQRASDIAWQVLGQPLAGRVVRIDLCTQFIGAASVWIGALKYARHSLIRKPNRIYEDETLYLKGRELEFCIYDKGLQSGLGRGNFVRLELRLKTPRLVSKCFGAELFFADLSFDKCYRVYRELCLGLTTETVLGSDQTITVATLLLLAESMGHRDLVSQAFGAMSRVTRSRTKKRMQASSLKRAEINLSALLPVGGFIAPSRVLVESSGNRRSGIANPVPRLAADSSKERNAPLQVRE
jgi:hypothetical protein